MPKSAARSEPAASMTARRSSIRCSRFGSARSEEHTSELQSHSDVVCRLLLEKKNQYWRSGPCCWNRLHVDRLRVPRPPQLLIGSPSGRHFFFHDAFSMDFHTLSLHDALPI